MTQARSDQDDTYSEEETVARREAAIQRMLKTPPKLHKNSKLGRAKTGP